MAITRQQLGEWLDAYFAAWRSNEAAEVEALFAPDAVYSYGLTARKVKSARTSAQSSVLTYGATPPEQWQRGRGGATAAPPRHDRR